MLFHAHSGLRYLVLLLGVVVIVQTALALATRKPYGGLTRGLASAFAGTLHLQVLLGLALLFTGRFSPALTGHIIVMVLAAAVAQIPVSVNKRRVEAERTHLPHLIFAVVALLLIWAGVTAIGRPLLGTGG
ncbi:MAG: hypothetical protein WEA09_08680 [Gemmatimonadota bacterium]